MVSTEGKSVLEQWGVSSEDAELIMNAIDSNKKIIIIGEVRTGKTLLLNELIRLFPTNLLFDYRARIF